MTAPSLLRGGPALLAGDLAGVPRRAPAAEQRDALPR